MRITELHLRNFKCFEELNLKLHPRFNVLVGVNGVGKTSLLEAIRVAIGSLYLGLDKYEDRIESPGIINDDVRLSGLEQQFPVVVHAIGVMDNVQQEGAETEMEWERQLKTREGKTLYRDAKQMLKASRDIQDRIRMHGEVNLPLVAYFSTDRYKKERRDIKIEPNGSRLRGYYNALDQTTNIRYFLNLYATETMDELQSGEKSLLLEAVNQSVKKCVNCKDVRYYLKQQELVLEYENGDKMPFRLLSDGVRSTLAMAMEIALRCYLLNPHLKAEAPSQTKGVVLIDELDLHLHPAWQKHVATDLRRAFPNLQFVVTTHAPLILSSLDDCFIFSINDRQVWDFPLQFGRDANYILDEMGVQGMEESIRQELEDYLILIEKEQGKTEKSQAIRRDLESKLGKNHPELQRADLMLSFFE